MASAFATLKFILCIPKGRDFRLDFTLLGSSNVKSYEKL